MVHMSPLIMKIEGYVPFREANHMEKFLNLLMNCLEVTLEIC